MQKAQWVLSAALAAVEKNMNAYGSPNEKFPDVADALSGLGFRYKGDPLSPKHIPMIMIVLKIVRELHKHQIDNLVDIVGYTACLSEMLPFMPVHMGADEAEDDVQEET